MHVKYLENYKCINYSNFYILEGYKEFLFEQYSNRVLVIITLMMKQIEQDLGLLVRCNYKSISCIKTLKMVIVFSEICKDW